MTIDEHEKMQEHCWVIDRLMHEAIRMVEEAKQSFKMNHIPNYVDKTTEDLNVARRLLSRAIDGLNYVKPLHSSKADGG